MRNIERGQVEQLERPEPESRLLAHDPVDVGETRDAFARDPQAFGIHPASGVIDDEAGHVLRAHRRVPHAAREVHQRVAGGGVAAQAVDHFDDLHQRHRIEEVKARDAFRTRAARRNRGDRQRRRIRRQNAALADHRFEVAKEFALDLELFDDRLDHDVAIRQIARLTGRVNAGEGVMRIGFLDLAFCRELVQCVGKIVAGGGDRLRVRVEETHGESAERRDLRDAAPHRAAADDADCLNLKIAKAHGVGRLLIGTELAQSCCIWDSVTSSR